MTGSGISGAADAGAEDEGADGADDTDGADGTDDADNEALSEQRDHVYKVALASAVALLATGTIVYRVAEDWSWVDSFYFSAIAITTVGFGDFAPTTDFAKLFTVAYIFLGISLIGVVLNERLRRHAGRSGRRKKRRTIRRDG